MRRWRTSARSAAVHARLGQTKTVTAGPDGVHASGIGCNHSSGPERWMLVSIEVE
jgi:hypothetical protein